MKWDGEVVGYISIRKSEAQASIGADNNTTVLTLPSSVGTSVSSTTNATNQSYINDTATTPDNPFPPMPPGVHHLYIKYIGFGQVLSRGDVYMGVLKTLYYIARFQSNAVVQPFSVSPPPPYDDTVYIRHLVFPQPPAGSEVFNYGWVARGLGALPRTMAGLNRWTEVGFEFLVDGVPIGEGAVAKGRR